MIYDTRGNEITAEDVLSQEELADYYAARRRRFREGVRYARTVPNSAERAERESEAALDRPWGDAP